MGIGPSTDPQQVSDETPDEASLTRVNFATIEPTIVLEMNNEYYDRTPHTDINSDSMLSRLSTKFDKCQIIETKPMSYSRLEDDEGIFLPRQAFRNDMIHSSDESSSTTGKTAHKENDLLTSIARDGRFNLIQKIFDHLNVNTVHSIRLVSPSWTLVSRMSFFWRNYLVDRVEKDEKWRMLSRRRGWEKYLFYKNDNEILQKPVTDDIYYQSLVELVLYDIYLLKINKRKNIYKTREINANSNSEKGIYCFQNDQSILISGHRDRTIKMYNIDNGKLMKTFYGHNGSVLCLQFEEEMLITGSSDYSVRIWNIQTGYCHFSEIRHENAVLCLKFNGTRLITCSKSAEFIVWEIEDRKRLVFVKQVFGHVGAINAIDFDDKFILSASGDRTLKIWDSKTCMFQKSLAGHSRGIACLHYVYPLALTGSSDNIIIVWNIEASTILHKLEGHSSLVRCIKFDEHWIVSGSYDGTLIYWNFEPKSLLDKDALITGQRYSMVKHTSRVFKIQFYSAGFITSSQDDTIILWDFLSDKFDDPTVFSPEKINHTLNLAKSALKK